MLKEVASRRISYKIFSNTASVSHCCVRMTASVPDVFLYYSYRLSSAPSLHPALIGMELAQIQKPGVLAIDPIKHWKQDLARLPG